MSMALTAVLHARAHIHAYIHAHTHIYIYLHTYLQISIRTHTSGLSAVFLHMQMHVYAYKGYSCLFVEVFDMGYVQHVVRLALLKPRVLQVFGMTLVMSMASCEKFRSRCRRCIRNLQVGLPSFAKRRLKKDTGHRKTYKN